MKQKVFVADENERFVLHYRNSERGGNNEVTTLDFLGGQLSNLGIKIHGEWEKKAFLNLINQLIKHEEKDG